MCRWLAYTGNSICLEDILFKAKHSLVDQSLSSRSPDTPTNGDGFGVGWYAPGRQVPGLFRSIRPAWNDCNLRDLASHIEAPLFLAHVRASSLTAVQETNCHPFRHGNWLFVHNGEIGDVQKIHRDLLLAVAPELFPQIQGGTDSELMFFLALTFGLEADPLGALARMAGFVEQTGRSRSLKPALWMTLGVSDGRNLYAVRYATDRDAPTLYCSRDMDDVSDLHPELKGSLDQTARLVVSEPTDDLVDDWQEVPENSSLHVVGAHVAVQPFAPSPADGAAPPDVGGKGKPAAPRRPRRRRSSS